MGLLLTRCNRVPASASNTPAAPAASVRGKRHSSWACHRSQLGQPQPPIPCPNNREAITAAASPNTIRPTRRVGAGWRANCRGGVRLRRTLLDTKTRDQPEQQRRPQQGRHGAGRDQHRPEPAQGLQQQIGGRQQQGAEDGCPQQPLGQFSDPSSRTMAGAASPIKPISPTTLTTQAVMKTARPRPANLRCLRDPQAASAGIVQLQHCQRAHQHHRQHRGQQQPWQQIADAAPAVLGQRSAPHTSNPLSSSWKNSSNPMLMAAR